MITRQQNNHIQAAKMENHKNKSSEQTSNQLWVEQLSSKANAEFSCIPNKRHLTLKP